MREDDPRLVFLPEADVQKPPGPMRVEAIVNAYWVVCRKRGLVFYKAGPREPAREQCNPSLDVTTRLAARLYPWAHVRRFPLVLVPFNL